MSDNFQQGDTADELDELPPELQFLHRRLSDDSVAWQRHLPSATSLERFAQAMPQHNTGAGARQSQRTTKGQVSMDEHTSLLRRPQQPYRVFIPAFVAIVVVALLVVIFVQFPSMHSLHPGGHRTATATNAAATLCTYHATVPAQVNLGDIAMSSPDDGWALGSTSGTDGYSIGVMLHYVHCQWQVTGTSYPDLNLTSLVMLSASDGWITGGSDDGKQQLVLHYVAGTWQRVTLPDGLATGGIPNKMVMIAPNEGWLEVIYPKDVYGLSHYSLLHYQQGNWTGINAPLAYIANISSAVSGDVWIVGSHQYNDGSTILAHYTNGTWSQQQGPTQLEAAQIHMTAPTDGVLVFSLYGANNAAQTVKNVAWRYNGVRWTPLDLGGDRTGQDLHLFSSTQGWAFSTTYVPGASSFTTPISGATYEVNGQWQATLWPFPDITGINSISRVSDSEYWATGVKRYTSPTGIALKDVFLHYSNGTWSEVGQ